MAARHELGRSLVVEVEPIRLVHGLAVPVETEPLERAVDDLDQLAPAALGVGVLDPQHELAAVLACVDPVEQGRARATDVQVARGRRRETDTDRGGRHPARLVLSR